MPIPLDFHPGRQGPPDLVETMLECHGRIRNFVDVARKIGAARGLPPPAIASAAADVQRYFRHGLPHHVEDEEKSLLPRLRGRSSELDVALAAMEQEHHDHEAPLAKLLALMDQLVAAPTTHAQLAGAVTAAAEALGAVFEQHLASEELRVFPKLKTLLSPAEQAQILTELRGRRAPLPPGVSRPRSV